jgi:hypothetical protein
MKPYSIWEGITKMDIGEAIEAMRDMSAVRREGWNGKGMFIKLQIPDGNSKMTQPYVYMKTVSNDLVPWVCSQSDLLANDWQLVDDEEVNAFESGLGPMEGIDDDTGL